jgi:hypothetical protein
MKALCTPHAASSPAPIRAFHQGFRHHLAPNLSALPFFAAVQLPDEREILKRRLKAEERKQNTSVALTVLDSSRQGSRTDKAKNAQAAWETGAGGGNFEPITLVVKNLR